MNQDLTIDELHSELGDLLPAREALGLFNVADITAANSSAALNLFSDDSTATSIAEQCIDVQQD